MNKLLALLVWPAIISLPLVLTWDNLYQRVFPVALYDETPRDFWTTLGTGVWPSPLGLSLGILAVIVGQVFTLAYFLVWKFGHLGRLFPVQKEGAPQYILSEGIATHLAQPEGFIMLGGYLTLTWMFGLMPASYYSFSGGINWIQVFSQLLLVDFLQYTMHYMEHAVSSAFYRVSHKPHHRFTNPKLFDAFNGSFLDTLCMILFPLAVTARCVDANVWSYMTFGSLYANWLVLIHAEYSHVWDPLFRWVGFGTSGDHHVHHKLFIFNYGHLFTYWDRFFVTFKSPMEVSVFNKDI